MTIRYPIPILLSGTNKDQRSGDCEGTHRIPRIFKGNLEPNNTRNK